MMLDWFKKRGYRHFDLPVNESFAKKAMSPAFVARHAFSPLLHYEKAEKRYKKNAATGVREMSIKARPIRYASHRDACILSYYAFLLNKRLEAHYTAAGISDSVLAYRSLGRGNYDFSAEVFAFAQSSAPVSILAFDVTSFFDNLDHRLLKHRLKAILDVDTLSEDWHHVYRVITAFHFVDLADLKRDPVFAARLQENSRDRIASVAELKARTVKFHPNPKLNEGRRCGIPQGTPISAAASNLYMMDFDAAARAYCDGIGALYRRYSDDILVVCRQDHADAVDAKIMALISDEKLEISPQKTERTEFGSALQVDGATRAAQYLGFTFHESGPGIRESSLARQWRKLRRAVRRTARIANKQIAAGNASKVYTKKLFRRFSHIKVQDGQGLRSVRNFSSYGRRSGKAFGPGEKITKQVKRFEQAALRDISVLRKSISSKPDCDLPEPKL